MIKTYKEQIYRDVNGAMKCHNAGRSIEDYIKSISGDEYIKNKIDINEELPPEGIPVLFFNNEWIDEDFNLLGVEMGVYFDDTFIHTKWNSTHDCFDTQKSKPTHWRSIY